MTFHVFTTLKFAFLLSVFVFTPYKAGFMMIFVIKSASLNSHQVTAAVDMVTVRSLMSLQWASYPF